MTAFDRPVLIGGTGRSGTTIAGRLLDAHPAFVLTTPRELRFISTRGGLVDPLATTLGWPLGDRTPAGPRDFATRLRTHYFRRRKASGARSGLVESMPREFVEAAAQEYEEHFATDPMTASIRLVHTLVPPTLRDRRDRRWVDSTPHNVRVAHHIHHLLPGARFVHMMRDGRDVAASFVSQNFGPSDALEAIDAWGQRMLEAGEAEAALPPGIVMRIDLAEWSRRGPRDALAPLLDFVGTEPSTEHEQWFAANVTAGEAHEGRWTRDLDARTQTRVTRRYEEWRERLRERHPDQRLPGYLPD